MDYMDEYLENWNFYLSYSRVLDKNKIAHSKILHMLQDRIKHITFPVIWANIKSISKHDDDDHLTFLLSIYFSFKESLKVNSFRHRLIRNLREYIPSINTRIFTRVLNTR